VLGDDTGLRVHDVLEGGDQQGVQSPPLTGEQVGVQRLSQQGVPQREAAVGLHHEQLGAHRLVDAVAELHLCPAARDELLEQSRRDPLARRRDHAQHLGRARRTCPGPAHEHLPQARGQGALVAGQRRPHQRLGRVGVAPRARVDASGQRLAEQGSRVSPEQVGELRAGLGERHRGQADLDHVRRPADVLQPFAEHLVDLVRPKGHDQGEVLAVQSRAEVGQHLQGRDVGAVQVVEHQDGGPDRRGAVQQGGDRGDQAGLVGRPLATDPELGQQQADVPGVGPQHLGDVGAGQPGQQGTEGGDQRCVRDPATEEPDAGPSADHRARRQPADHLVEQPGLAPARLAVDQRHAGLVVGGVGDQAEDGCELLLPAHEPLASRHAPHSRGADRPASTAGLR
jgi:hypothetical protein